MAERTPAKFSFHRPVFHDALNQSWFDDLDLKQLQKRDEKRQLKRNGELQTSGHICIRCTSMLCWTVGFFTPHKHLEYIF